MESRLIWKSGIRLSVEVIRLVGGLRSLEYSPVRYCCRVTDVYVWSRLNVELGGRQRQTFLPVDDDGLRRHAVPSDVSEQPVNISAVPINLDSDVVSVVERRSSDGW